MKNLAKLEKQGDFPDLIEGLRNLVQQDRRTVSQKWVKRWLARRWRNLFLNEAVTDPVALKAATGVGDSRPARERIAKRFLYQTTTEEWTDDLPPAEEATLPRTTLVLSPGLLNGFLPQRAFGDAMEEVGKRFQMGMIRSDNNPLRGSDANLADLERAFDHGLGLTAGGEPIAEENAKPPEQVLLIGYSKGSVDALNLLVKRPKVQDRVACFFSWAGPVLGTPAADDGVKILDKLAKVGVDLKSLKGKPPKLLKRLMPASAWKRFFDRGGEYDIRASLESLTTKRGNQFFAEHGDSLDSSDIPMFFMAGVTGFRKVPLSQKLGYLRLKRIDPQNDMQVIASRAKLDLPMATRLSLMRGHHWDLAYPSFSKFKFTNGFHPFPRKAALVAMVQLAAELGLVD